MPAPPYPWKKGHQESYSCFVVEVEVAVDLNGVPYSTHKLQDNRDMKTCSTLKAGGMEATSHAFLTEFVRKEAFYQVLVKLSNDPDFKEKLLFGTEDELAQIEGDITSAMMGFVREAVQALAPDAAREALALVRQDPPDEPAT